MVPRDTGERGKLYYFAEFLIALNTTNLSTKRYNGSQKSQYNRMKYSNIKVQGKIKNNKILQNRYR